MHVKSQFALKLSVLALSGLAFSCGDGAEDTTPWTGTVTTPDGGGFGLPDAAFPVDTDASATNDAGVWMPVLDGGGGGTSDGSVPMDDGAAPMDDGSMPGMDDGAVDPPMDDGGTTTPMDGTCCSDGDCLCHGPNPTALTSSTGPYDADSYSIPGVGCVYYPTDAEPPFAAVAISDGFLGTGGCGFSQTGNWGPLYASWGIVAMIIETGSGDQPPARGDKLTRGVAAFKSANESSSSPLFGKLAGRYGTSGFSMGGGGTSYASQDDSTLKSSVAIMPWGPVTSGIEVPTLVICGSSDGTAACRSHGNRLYSGIDNSVPKMRVTVSSGHAGQPSAGRGMSGAYGLAFQKVFLEGDERWRPLLVAADSDETNIR